jgi:glutamate synthase domain-containing protein 3
VRDARAAIEDGEPVELGYVIRNVNRCVGGILSSHIAQRHGAQGLADDAIRVRFRGSAGQSFGGWLAPGVAFTLEGDANDYTGKGLSGGTMLGRPPQGATYRAEENVAIGNVVLYGATSGKAFFRGLAGERFCVRNSGASAVVEGVGDHGCEYMTGGRAVILGPTGRNFAAGMSGGIAYVYDPNDEFITRCNLAMVELEKMTDEKDVTYLRMMIEKHRSYTDSPVADSILKNWNDSLKKFHKVMPIEYKKALAQMALAASNAGGK